MKNKNLKRIFGATIMLLAAMIIMQGAVSAQDSDPKTNARHNRIVGLWDVQATNKNCADGTTLASFRALHKYELGGTAQVVPATNPARLSSHVGVWNWVDDNNYQLAFKMFRFDATGNNIGWVVVRNNVSISEDGTEYTGSGRAETFDSSGTSLGVTCPSFTGTRFQ